MQVWKNVASNCLQILIFIYFEYYFADVQITLQILHSKLIKNYLIYIRVSKHVATNSLQIQIAIYFEQYIAGVHASHWYRRSAAHHCDMSIERRATCSAYPPHCSTVVNTIITTDREAEHMHIVSS